MLLWYATEVTFSQRSVVRSEIVVQLFHLNFIRNVVSGILTQCYYTYPLSLGHMCYV
jgi:hypothetical protein